jgi:hypothetical protein
MGLRVRWLGALLALMSSSSDAAAQWPALPTSGFISGRLATEADLKRGSAVFLSLVDGKPSGRPARVVIPQFAHLIDERGVKLPVVVVQAEMGERGTLFGVKDAKGNEYVATESEVVLLGASHP